MVKTVLIMAPAMFNCHHFFSRKSPIFSFAWKLHENTVSSCFVSHGELFVLQSVIVNTVYFFIIAQPSSILVYQHIAYICLRCQSIYCSVLKIVYIGYAYLSVLDMWILKNLTKWSQQIKNKKLCNTNAVFSVSLPKISFSPFVCLSVCHTHTFYRNNSMSFNVFMQRSSPISVFYTLGLYAVWYIPTQLS